MITKLSRLANVSDLKLCYLRDKQMYDVIDLGSLTFEISRDPVDDTFSHFFHEQEIEIKNNFCQLTDLSGKTHLFRAFRMVALDPETDLME